MIRQQQEGYSWNFIYLGADQDALRESERIGILFDVDAVNVASYAHSSSGVRSAYLDIARSVQHY